MEIYSIYSITNNVTGRVYVGRTIDANGRFYWHKKLLRENRHPTEDLQRDYNELGLSAFTFGIICEIADWEEASVTEKRLIREQNNPYNKLGNPNFVHHVTRRWQTRMVSKGANT